MRRLCSMARPAGPATLPLSKMTVGGWLPGRRGDRPLSQAVFVQLVPDELGARGSDALADREGKPQVHGGFGGIMGQEAHADSGQGAGFLGLCADLTGDGERLAMVATGLL
jgi:hypothetical protein